jgi:MFS family permease
MEALVIFALVPCLALTSAVTPRRRSSRPQVGLSPRALQLTDGLANAGYAFGTVLAVQFAVHLRGRRMLILYATLFPIGSVLAALALTPGLFIAGRVLTRPTAPPALRRRRIRPIRSGQADVSPHLVTVAALLAPAVT